MPLRNVSPTGIALSMSSSTDGGYDWPDFMSDFANWSIPGFLWQKLRDRKSSDKASATALIISLRCYFGTNISFFAVVDASRAWWFDVDESRHFRLLVSIFLLPYVLCTRQYVNDKITHTASCGMAQNIEFTQDCHPFSWSFTNLFQGKTL